MTLGADSFTRVLNILQNCKMKGISFIDTVLNIMTEPDYVFP